MIVVDVETVSHLLMEGERTPVSEALLKADPEWAAPLVWRTEWRSVLARYVRRGVLDRGAAEEAVREAEGLFQGREYLVDGGRVMDLAAGSDVSVYDCEYVVLAEVTGVPFVTAKADVRAAFPERARSPEEYLERAAPGDADG